MSRATHRDPTADEAIGAPTRTRWRPTGSSLPLTVLWLKYGVLQGSDEARARAVARFTEKDREAYATLVQSAAAVSQGPARGRSSGHREGCWVNGGPRRHGARGWHCARCAGSPEGRMDDLLALLDQQAGGGW